MTMLIVSFIVAVAAIIGFVVVYNVGHNNGVKVAKDISSTCTLQKDKAYRQAAKLANKIHRQRLTIKYLKQFAPKKPMVN